MEKEKKVKDVDFADSAVPASARKNVVTMFMIYDHAWLHLLLGKHVGRPAAR